MQLLQKHMNDYVKLGYTRLDYVPVNTVIFSIPRYNNIISSSHFWLGVYIK